MPNLTCDYADCSTEITDKLRAIWLQITTDQRYQRNIAYGKPRRGHAEGKVSAHIDELETNLTALRTVGLISPIHYWKLKILIHVHDTFKAESKHDVSIVDPESHASIAARYVSGYTDDSDMINITQYHDVGYSIYRKYKEKGRFDENRLTEALAAITDIDLFLLFVIIDGCTASKGRESIKWLVERVRELRPEATITAENIIPVSSTGTEPAGDVW